MTEKTIQEIARERAYEKASKDLSARVLSMQESARKHNVDPVEIALIGSAYHPLADHILKMLYLEGEDVNTVTQVLNRFTATLATEFVAAVARLMEIQGTSLSPRQFVPFVQEVINDHCGRIDASLAAVMHPVNRNQPSDTETVN